MRSIPWLPLTLLLCLPAWAGASPRVEGRLELNLRMLGLLDRNVPGSLPRLLPASYDQSLVGLALGVGGTLAVGNTLELTLGFDTRLTTVEDGAVLANGRPLAEEAEATGFLREARLHLWLPGQLQVDAGRGRRRVGEGFILDSEALGADVAVDAGDFTFQIGALWPGRDLEPSGSLLVHGRLTQHLDLTRSLYLFVAGDAPEAAVGTSALRELVAALAPDVPRLADCAHLAGHSVRAFAGAGVDLLLEEHWITAVAIRQLGRAQINVRSLDEPSCGVVVQRILGLFPQVDAEVDAFALDIGWRVRLTEVLYPGVFGTWLSGDTQPFVGDWTVFAPPAALLGRTLVFFNAGATTPVLEETLDVAGLQARGVRATGITLLAALSRALEVDGVVAFLWPDAGPGYYGTEYNARVRWQVSDTWRLLAEAGVLDEGDFFGGPERWWQATLMVGWQPEALPLGPR